MSATLERRRDLSSAAPFYTLPQRKTSAQIIREARNDISFKGLTAGALPSLAPRNSVKTVQTKRPFTPRTNERTLFGTPAAVRGERPPSSFTLSPLNFDPSELGARPGTGMALITLTQAGGEPELVKDLDESIALPTRLPSLQTRKGARTQQFQHNRTLSLTDLPEEGECDEESSGPLHSLPPAQVAFVPAKLDFNEDVLCSPSYQRLLMQDDVVLSELDSTMEEQSLRRMSLPNTQEGVTLGPLHPSRKLSGPLPLSKMGSWKEQRQTSTSLDILPRPMTSEVHAQSVMKRPGVDRPWQYAVDASGPFSLDTAMDAKREEEEQQHLQQQQAARIDFDQSMFYEEKVSPMLDEITRALGCAGVSDSVLSELVDKLYSVLDNASMLGRHFKYRSQVLRTVFKLVDREHGQLLASLARIMLALRVSGSNLTSVCKLVFKVTRDDTNDHLFLTGPLLGLLLEAVGRVSPLESAEAAVYGYGALKFLTMNSSLVTRLLSRGVLELLTLHMMLIVNEVEEKGSVPQQTAYALVQLTATLRHVSSCERTFPKMLEAGAVTQVCRLLPAFKDDTDVTANLARILSIVSTQPECCEAAAAHPATLPACVQLLATHSRHPAIVVRVAYALGNMMASDDDARYNLFSVNGFTDTVLTLLSEYLKQDRESQAVPDPLSPTNATPEDVMVKLVRVLANVAVDPRVGPVLARSKTCQSLMMSLVQHKSVTESEELVLSCFATLNNLSFYSRHGPPSSLHTDLAQCLSEMVPMDHVEGLVEAVRVFGNLTHFREVRDILTKNQVVEVLVEMLDCDSRELVYVCSGVLVNIMSDASRRAIFQQENGVLRMVEVLQYFGCGDWQLCSLACQVLWNYCATAADVHSVLGSLETSRLVAVLDALLDEGSHYLPENEDDPEARLVGQLWEDFARVATKLLDRIDNSGALPLLPGDATH